MAECSVFVDYFLVYCEEGNKTDSGYYDQDITLSATRDGYDGNILHHYLVDEPTFDQFEPYGYVNKIIEDSTEAQWSSPVSGITAFLQDRAQGEDQKTGIYDFIKIGEPEKIWIDIYPFRGDLRDWPPKTLYSGSGASGTERGQREDCNGSSIIKCIPILNKPQSRPAILSHGD
jgi:hypothetical protein